MDKFVEHDVITPRHAGFVSDDISNVRDAVCRSAASFKSVVFHHRNSTKRIRNVCGCPHAPHPGTALHLTLPLTCRQVTNRARDTFTRPGFITATAGTHKRTLTRVRTEFQQALSTLDKLVKRIGTLTTRVATTSSNTDVMIEVCWRPPSQ